MRPFSHQSWIYALSFFAVAAITVWIYWSGLHGPFLLDDQGNLAPVKRWLDGDLDVHGVLDNRSGPLGRPLSMLTFMANAAMAGTMDSWAFKPTNLLIHLACGGVLFALARRLVAATQQGDRTALLTATFVTTIWLWLPLQVSTVLYVVQRMAQLSTLAILCALLVYATVRPRLWDNSGSTWLTLWVAIPAIAVVGMLAKENAVLTFALIAVIEFTIFNDPISNRPTQVKAFFLLTVALPALLAAIYIAVHPVYISGGYSLRSFTLTERLLTEPRILWSYVHTLLLPIGADLGLFHDNYIVSTSLFTPPTTAIAITAWLATIAIGWKVRNRYPLISCGIGIFLVGHALESTIIPLELYFEHRNYLPSVGAALVVGGGALALKHRLKSGTPIFRFAMLIGACLLPAFYAAGTWVQASSWANGETLYAMQESYNPTSPRLQSMLAGRAIEAGDLQSALAHIDLSEHAGLQAEKTTATIWRFLAYCAVNAAPPDALYREFDARTDLPITTFSMLGVELLAQRIDSGCEAVNAQRFAGTLAKWLASDHRDPSLQNLWRTRFNLARIMANQSVTIQVTNVANQAWIDSDYNNGIGIFLFQLYATLGDRQQCERVLTRLSLSERTGDRDLSDAIRTFRAALKDGSITPPLAPETH
jgi:hypothetical protein